MLVMEKTRRKPWPCFMYSSLLWEEWVRAANDSRVHGVDLPHSRCGNLVSQRSKYDDWWYSLNCSVPAVSRLHVISSATSYPCASTSTSTCIGNLHLEYALSALARCCVNEKSTTARLYDTHIYFDLFAIGVFDCRVIALNPDILDELGCELISD
jgi:hypothetical protein